MKKVFKNKEKLKRKFGIVFFIVVILLIFSWERGGRESFMYQDIIVLNKDVEANQVITERMLGVIKVDKSTLIKDAITNPDDIIGMETTTFIPRALPLSKKFFETQEMSVGNGRYIFSIPDDWIYSYPQSLRRGDNVYFYSIKKRVETEVDPYMALNNTYEDIVVPKTPILKTKVAYVKDSSNREVVDTSVDRMDGSAVVGKLEVVVNDADYQKLLNSYKDGNVLLVLYN